MANWMSKWLPVWSPSSPSVDEELGHKVDIKNDINLEQIKRLRDDCRRKLRSSFHTGRKYLNKSECDSKKLYEILLPTIRDEFVEMHALDVKICEVDAHHNKNDIEVFTKKCIRRMGEFSLFLHQIQDRKMVDVLRKIAFFIEHDHTRKGFESALSLYENDGKTVFDCVDFERKDRRMERNEKCDSVIRATENVLKCLELGQTSKIFGSWHNHSEVKWFGSITTQLCAMKAMDHEIISFSRKEDVKLLFTWWVEMATFRKGILEKLERVHEGFRLCYASSRPEILEKCLGQRQILSALLENAEFVVKRGQTVSKLRFAELKENFERYKYFSKSLLGPEPEEESFVYITGERIEALARHSNIDLSKHPIKKSPVRPDQMSKSMESANVQNVRHPTVVRCQLDIEKKSRTNFTQTVANVAHDQSIQTMNIHCQLDIEKKSRTNFSQTVVSVMHDQTVQPMNFAVPTERPKKMKHKDVQTNFTVPTEQMKKMKHKDVQTNRKQFCSTACVQTSRVVDRSIGVQTYIKHEPFKAEDRTFSSVEVQTISSAIATVNSEEHTDLIYETAMIPEMTEMAVQTEEASSKSMTKTTMKDSEMQTIAKAVLPQTVSVDCQVQTDFVFATWKRRLRVKGTDSGTESSPEPLPDPVMPTFSSVSVTTTEICCSRDTTESDRFVLGSEAQTERSCIDTICECPPVDRVDRGSQTITNSEFEKRSNKWPPKITSNDLSVPTIENINSPRKGHTLAIQKLISRRNAVRTNLCRGIHAAKILAESDRDTGHLRHVASHVGVSMATLDVLDEEIVRQLIKESESFSSEKKQSWERILNSIEENWNR